MQNIFWQELQEYYNSVLKNVHLKELLQDEKRNQSLIATFEDIVFDYTHQKINEKILDHFNSLAQKTHLFKKIEDMFQGEKINVTQKRAVLHTALRLKKSESLIIENKNVVEDVHAVLDSIKVFSQKVRLGEIVGFTGKKLRNVVTIGIGGSYLSLEFVYEALRSEESCKNSSADRAIRFLANVDPIDFSRAVQNLNPEQTIFVINSKTFTTAQTMLNARTCRTWLMKEYQKLGIKQDEKKIVSFHMCACSTNLQETGKFGIDSNKVFGFWDFIGGRFSVWSAIGILPLSLHFGFDKLQSFIEGGRSIDTLFLKQRNISKNLPVLLGLIGFYRTSIQKYSSRAILPYCQALCKFVPHVQQLDMESNGKRVNLAGKQLPYQTAVVNFGEPGTNGQHSFYQLLHQGRIIPAQFIGFSQSQQPVHYETQVVSNHDQLMSNFFSQPDALAIGKTIQQLKHQKTPQFLLGHKQFPGDRPSTSILFLNRLNPYTCGQLLALYEHRTSVEGFVWDINSYDQWGVQLGKVLATNVRNIFINSNQGKAVNYGNINSATKSLLQKYLQTRK